MRKSWILLGALLVAACDDERTGGAGDAGEPSLRRRDARVTPPAPRDASVGADAEPDRDAADDADAAVERDAANLEPDAAVVERDAAIAPEPDAAIEPERDAAIPNPQIDPACRAALAAATFTFEQGPQEWAHEPSDGVDIDWPLDPWEHGASTHDPDACREGRACWGTSLDDNLVQCQRAELESPLIDLTACARYEVTLVFDHWYSFWAGRVDGQPYFDGGTVWAGNEAGGVYEPIAEAAFPGVIAINPELGFDYSCVEAFNFHVDGQPGYVQDSGGWVEARLPLGGIHRDSRIGLHFAYATGVSAETTDPWESQQGSPSGWTIDHVRFEAR